MKKIDLRGNKYGRLLVIEKAGFWDKRTWWRCLCDCGKTTQVMYTNLVYKGNTTSCGCLRKEKRSENNRKHGLSQTKIYRAYYHAKARCDNKNDFRYPLYGGRGIRFLWKSFDDFVTDMMDSFEEHIKKDGIKNTTLERANVNGDYCKENCTWATWKEQQNNRRNTGLNLDKHKKEVLLIR